jgi:hypothetical protein
MMRNMIWKKKSLHLTRTPCTMKGRNIMNLPAGEEVEVLRLVGLVVVGKQHHHLNLEEVQNLLLM